jgi:predicted DNA-binding antitoxin AbrB/MazE fold protein
MLFKIVVRERILKPLSAQLVSEGEKVEMRVEYNKREETEVRWFHNGKEVKKSKEIEIDVGEHVSTLKLSRFDSKLTTGRWETRVGKHSKSSCTVRTKGG